MSQELWTTRDGRKLRVDEMSARHIENTVRMLKKKREEALVAMDTIPSFQGEMAQMEAERMASLLDDMVLYCDHWIDRFERRASQTKPIR